MNHGHAVVAWGAGTTHVYEHQEEFASPDPRYRIRTMQEVLDDEFGAYRALLGILAALTLLPGAEASTRRSRTPRRCASVR